MAGRSGCQSSQIDIDVQCISNHHCKGGVCSSVLKADQIFQFIDIRTDQAQWSSALWQDRFVVWIVRTDNRTIADHLVIEGLKVTSDRVCFEVVPNLCTQRNGSRQLHLNIVDNGSSRRMIVVIPDQQTIDRINGGWWNVG